MPKRLVFDLETDGLLPTLSRVHSLVIGDIDTGRLTSCALDADGRTPPGFEPLSEGLKALEDADELIGHNIIKFDLPALQRVFPSWSTKAAVTDTLVLSNLIHPAIKDQDGPLLRAGFPKPLYGKHSLEAWGYRIGNYKGDFRGPWDCWTTDMQEYCEQDVRVTMELWRRLAPHQYSAEAVALEHRVAAIISRMERNGFWFDRDAAGTLHATLAQRKHDLRGTLQDAFGPVPISLGLFEPKVDRPALGVEKGAPFTKIKLATFNPASRKHCAFKLRTMYGWKATAFTPGGDPQIDDEILGALDYPEAKLLAEFFTVDKRLGALAEGDHAWLAYVDTDGFIHGSVRTNGAVTGRATHSHPNIAQVPKVGSPYGAECRALFGAPAGWVLLGTDQSGLELRCLGHFMAIYDGGAYARACIEGKSEDETDVHSLNCKALGMEPKTVYTLAGKTAKGRDFAKTFIYALLYGAGVGKIAAILGTSTPKAKKIMAAFFAALPALAKLIERVKLSAGRGYLKGLDGRKLHIRSDHAALNTLLQSAGALVCKRWIVELIDALDAAGLRSGWDQDYCLCAWVHDELQIACRTREIAECIGHMAVEAAALAGTHFNFNCPTTADFKIGRTWADTH